MRVHPSSLMFLAVASTAAALLVAPCASADPGGTLPNCTSVATDGLGGSTTECATPGNVQINSSAPDPVYAYPWDDEFYGPALLIGRDGGGGRR
jgi:hypothetical protein